MMDEATSLRFYRTGLFVLFGFALLVCFILFLAGVNWFHQPTYMETYFDESVQGLTEGSAVKYRGVAVGEVDEINFIGDHYRDRSIIKDPHLARYVYVRMDLHNMSFLATQSQSFGEKLEEAVASGFRVHLAQEGLTGKAYLELDFAPAHGDETLPIKWRPKLYYVPSRPSTLFTVSASINALFDGMKDMNFDTFFANLEHAMGGVSLTFDRLGSMLLMQQDNIAKSLDNMSRLTHNLSLATENISTYPSGFMRMEPADTDQGGQ